MKIIAPDRIQIIDIDLRNVKISGLESQLKNMDVKKELPEEKPADEPKEEPKIEEIKEEPKEEEVKEETPIALPEEKPEEPKPEQPEPKPEPKKKDPPKKPQAQTTVIKVNRESASPDRTITVSVIDALRIAMTRCWNIDAKRPGMEDMRVVAHLKMHRGGRVRDYWFEQAARADRDPAFAYVLETIRDAIEICSPFSMLPDAEFEHWQTIQLTFYPTAKIIE